MIESVIFQLGNIIADASIATFSLIVFLYERQRNRINRLLSLLSSLSKITQAQVGILAALVDIGDENTLKGYIETNTQIGGSELEKFKAIRRNLDLLHFSNMFVIVMFAVGIVIEAIAVMQSFGVFLTSTACLAFCASCHII